MNLIMYGTDICPDCLEAKELLKNHPEIGVDYRIITDKTSTLKEFLSYRDHDEVFAPVINGGGIGIPFFILEDGRKTFDISDFIEEIGTGL